MKDLLECRIDDHVEISVAFGEKTIYLPLSHHLYEDNGNANLICIIKPLKKGYMMKSKKKLFTIILIMGSILSLYFVPGGILSYWLSPKTDTIQEVIDYASEYGFDGVLVYVDHAGQIGQYAAGWS